MPRKKDYVVQIVLPNIHITLIHNSPSRYIKEQRVNDRVLKSLWTIWISLRRIFCCWNVMRKILKGCNKQLKTKHSWDSLTTNKFWLWIFCAAGWLMDHFMEQNWNANDDDKMTMLHEISGSIGANVTPQVNKNDRHLKAFECTYMPWSFP